MKQQPIEESLFLRSLGLRIQALRRIQGKAQSEIAKQCKMGKASLSRLESGQANATALTLKKIADSMNVTLASLFLPVD